MKIVLAMLLLALAGCAPAPLVKEAQVVEVAVPVKCPGMDKIGPRPVWATDKLGAAATHLQILEAVLSELPARTAYMDKLEAAVAACKGKS